MLKIKEENVFCTVLLFSTLLIYLKVLYFDFVNFDDPIYITTNDHILAGFQWEDIKWAFTSFHATNWHPLTWFSHNLDFYCYGLIPAGHHVTNIILHSINSLLVFYYFRETTGYNWRSFIIAGFFALHPLHVESVAWVSERKDVLSAFFWLLTMILHFRFLQTKKYKYYSLSLLTFILGLLSKPMVVTLPFALILLETWPLNRITFEKRSDTFKQIKASFLEKTPFFLFSLMSCLITYLAQDRGGAVITLNYLPYFVRISNSFVSYTRYIWKIFWPDNLAIQYPHPGTNIDYIFLLLSIAILVAISIMAFRLIRVKPFLFSGWFWFLGTLIPVIGLVQVGSQAMADRYTYIPAIGIFIMICFWGTEYNKKFQSYFIYLSSAFLIVFAILTWYQLDVWKSSKTLFANSIQHTRNNSISHYLLGQALAAEGNFDDALDQAKLSVLFGSNFAEAHNTLGTLYLQKNMENEAVKHFKEAIKLKPSLWHPYANIGLWLAKKGEYGKADFYLQKADKFLERNAYNHVALGIAWAKIGNSEKAIEHFQASLLLRPDAANTLNNLGKTLLDSGDVVNAKYYLNKALGINPDSPEIINNYGLVLLKENDIEGAIINFSYALKLNPDYEKARINLYKSIKLFSKSKKRMVPLNVSKKSPALVPTALSYTVGHEPFETRY